MPRRQLSVLLVGYSAFVALGLYDGLLGVAWPSIQAHFGLPLDAFGILIIALPVGHISASAATGSLTARKGVAWVLIAAAVLGAAGLYLQAAAPVWLMVIGGAVVLGVGAGFLDTGMNIYASAQWRARLINWLHACFGIGTTLGALLMTALIALELNWRFGPAVLGSVYALLAVLFFARRRQWRLPQVDVPEDEAPTVSAAATLRLPIVQLSILLFALHSGIEVLAGRWAFTILTESRGVEPELAGLLNSAYWFSLTLGRFLLGFLDTQSRWLVRGAMASLIGGALLFSLPALPLLSVIGLMIIGFSIAPIFPTLVGQTPGRFGRAYAAHAMGFQVGAAGFGAALLPAAAGVLADNVGLEIIPIFLLVATVIFFLVHELLLRRPRPATPQRRRPETGGAGSS